MRKVVMMMTLSSLCPPRRHYQRDENQKQRRHVRKTIPVIVATMIVLQMMIMPVEGFINQRTTAGIVGLGKHEHHHALFRTDLYNLQYSRLNASTNDSEEKEEDKSNPPIEMLSDGGSPQFGDVVPLSSRASSSSSSSDNINAQFGDVVRMPSSSSSSASSSISDDTLFAATSPDTRNGPNDASAATATTTENNRNTKNIVVAIVSISLAIMNYFWQFTHPISPVQLLFTLQQESDPISIVGKNSKPTIVDFWAPW